MVAQDTNAGFGPKSLKIIYMKDILQESAQESIRDERLV